MSHSPWHVPRSPGVLKCLKNTKLCDIKRAHNCTLCKVACVDSQDRISFPYPEVEPLALIVDIPMSTAWSGMT